MSRERPPPRGPKGMHEPPIGPRAGYGSEFRGGARGRGRGRGFRDDSRDRGRDLDRDRNFGRDYNHRDDRGGGFRDRSREREPGRERDFRNVGPDRRDNRGRGGGAHLYRGERSREREWHRDSFHNRNPSPRRSRSPDVRSSRGSRDGHLNLDLDRAHRGIRDGPLSAGSSSSDPSVLASSQLNRGGYGRGRGLARGEWEPRGGGRARYSEDRFRGRSRSQERDTRDLVRGRGGIRTNRDDRGRRDERGIDISRATNERRLSSWDSPIAAGPSPSSAKDDSHREEGEINREPSRAEIAGRRKINSDFGLNRGGAPNERFTARRTSQSPPSVTLVPAFGSVTGRPAPLPSVPSVPAQGIVTSKSNPVAPVAPVIAVVSTAERPPAMTTPALPVLPISRAPPTAPTAPKADRSKPISESSFPSTIDHRPSPGTGSNAVSPLSIRKESQDAQNISNLEAIQHRGASQTMATPRSAVTQNFSNSSQPLDRIVPGSQVFAGQKHARSESEPDASHGSPCNPSMPAPSIPTGPRADRAKNAPSPSNTNKMRYTPAQQKMPNVDLVPLGPRDSRSSDLGQSPSITASSANRSLTSVSNLTIQPSNSDPPDSESKGLQDPKQSLQREAMELTANLKIKLYHPAFKASKAGTKTGTLIDSRSRKPILVYRPLEIDNKDSYDENATDSDSGDEDELDEAYFQAEHVKLTAELSEVQNIPKSEGQLFPPCDLTIEDLAFAEIHDADITIGSDLSSKQSSLAPIVKPSPSPPPMDVRRIPLGVQTLSPKPEINDMPSVSRNLVPANFPVAATLSPQTDGAPVIIEETIPQLESLCTILSGIRTPSPSSLEIKPDTCPFAQDLGWKKSIVLSDRYQEVMKAKMRAVKQRERESNRKERAEYARYYKHYLEVAAILDSENPHMSVPKVDLAVKDVKRASATVLSIEARPEGGRSTRNSHQSQLELEAVLRASEQEAQDLQKKFDNKAQSKPNYAVEARIPDQLTPLQREQTIYFDKSGLVPFKDATDVFGFGEFVTNFTPEERRTFEKAYRKNPKQWGLIAETLENRDFHDCIAHYYSVKCDPSWPFKTRKVKAPKTRGGNKPRSKTLVADSRDLDEEQNDRQGRRLTRAAVAGTENVPSESEATTPAPASGKRAPTPLKTLPTPVKGRALTPAPPKKGVVCSKQDFNLATNQPEKKPRKQYSRAAGAKKARNAQILTPAQNTNPQPAIEDIGGKNDSRHRGGAAAFVDNNFRDYVPREPATALPSTDISMSMPQQTYQAYDNMTMMQQPAVFDSQQQDRRGLQGSTSSYWSVPEVTDFPQLLKAFGTDWTEIANYMTSKTHIMVFTTKFHEWLIMPNGMKKSHLVANVQEQVKNYYQRQIEQGKVDLEKFAMEADQKKAQGKKLDLPTASGLIPKRPYNSTTQLAPVPGSEGFEDLPPKMQPSPVRQTSPPSQPNLSSRFPALAQAGPVPQSAPEATHTVNSVPLKPSHHQRQSQMQQRPFASPRGPSSSYINNADRERPILSASTTPQAQPFVPPQEQSGVIMNTFRAAERERQEALRLQLQNEQRLAIARERGGTFQNEERREVQGQGHGQERQLRMKQETVSDQNLQQYEQYPLYSQQSNLVAPPRIESRVPSPASDTQRVVPSQPFGSRNQNPHARMMSESLPTTPHGSRGSPNLISTRTTLPVAPNAPQHYSSPATPVPPPPAAPPREASRGAMNIMSLLNDEPSDPRPTPPPKRVNEVASGGMPRAQSPNLQQQSYPPPRIHTNQSSLRRESSQSDLYNSSQNYNARILESPYSTGPPQSRSQMASPMDSSPATDRDFFPSRQQQQQQSFSMPPMPGPISQSGSTFQNQQSHQSNHRHVAFGQQSQRTASPPSQYSSQMHMTSSRSSSFDGRQGQPPNSIPSQQVFGQSHQHQGSPMPVHHQHAHQHPLSNSRFGGPQAAPSQMQQHLSHPRTQASHYGQGSSHSAQPSSSGPIRTFTPSSYESRSYAMSSPGPSLQQQSLGHDQQQSMLRRQMQQQQDAAMRHEQHRQPENGYDSGYSRRGTDGYDQIYEERRDERRMDETRR